MKRFRVLSLLLLLHSVGVFTGLADLPYSSFNRPKCTKEDTCIDIYECPYFIYLLRVKRKEDPHYVVQEMRDYQCGFIEDNRPKVCCSEEHMAWEKTDSKEEETADVDHKNLHLLPLESCGNVKLHARITNGETPYMGEFPWMAMLFYSSNKGPDFLCGGSLISDIYVLTAAHCIHDTILGVRLGEYNVMTLKDCEKQSTVCAAPHQDFHIDSIVIHPDYDKRTQANDIALIRLAMPADLTTGYVAPICLPLRNNTAQEKNMLTVAGWGLTEKGIKSPILKKADVPEVPAETCRTVFRHYAEVLDTHICAGGKKKDSCNGDSGGPLFNIATENDRPKYVQVGIVSYGTKLCGTFGLPGIYTNVQMYVDWILNEIRPY